MIGHDERAPVAEGDILAGKYRVDRVLGVGGMGIVVAATHEHLDQKVAIKFLLPAVSTNADLVRRFLREGRACGKLKSEHVARVLDVGRLENGSPFMVLEYLEGQDLSEVLDAQGPLPVPTAVHYILQAIEAVAEAHAAKIIHRDLKPQNLFLTRRVNGEPLVKVLDFGISKALEEASAELSLTRSQSLLGSPLYMSPEQMRSSRNVDERADIWSLGVLLHELLTARHPFESDTVPGLVFQVTMEAPTSVREHRADIDPGLEAVIARCLAKDVRFRYPNVAELARDLEPFGDAAAKGLAASIAAVLKAGTGRASYTSFPDSMSARAEDPLAPTLDAQSDPDVARALEESVAKARESAAHRIGARGGPELAASAWGATQSGTAPPRPRWQYAVAAVGLIGLGGVGAVFARPQPPEPPRAGAPVSAVASGTPTAPLGAPSASPPGIASATATTATIASAEQPSVTTPAPGEKPPAKPGARPAAHGAPSSLTPAPASAAPPPAQPSSATKPPPPKPKPGPPGFVEYGE